MGPGDVQTQVFTALTVQVAEGGGKSLYCCLLRCLFLANPEMGSFSHFGESCLKLDWTCLIKWTAFRTLDQFRDFGSDFASGSGLALDFLG